MWRFFVVLITITNADFLHLTSYRVWIPQLSTNKNIIRYKVIILPREEAIQIGVIFFLMCIVFWKSMITLLSKTYNKCLNVSFLGSTTDYFIWRENWGRRKSSVVNISLSYLQEKVKFGFTELIGSAKSENVFHIMSDLRFEIWDFCWFEHEFKNTCKN